MKGFVRELKSGYVAPNNFHEIDEDKRWIRSVGRNRVQILLTEPLPEGTVIVSGARAAVTLLGNSNRFLDMMAKGWIRAISVINYVY